MTPFPYYLWLIDCQAKNTLEPVFVTFALLLKKNAIQLTKKGTTIN